jgi:23S rRNA (adenine2503-C2)-methyltransferase
MKLNLKDHAQPALRERLAALGVEPYRGSQVFRWVWRRRASSPSEMTDLPKALRDRLEAEAEIPSLELKAAPAAHDGTIKMLAGLKEGREVECVIIPDDKHCDDEEDAKGHGRRTLCISTQVGCAMGCTFCRTATMGLVRHLAPWEIADQVLLAERVLADRGEEKIVHTGRGPAGEVRRRLTNLVFMGMVEPLHNFDGTVESLRILTDPQGLAFPGRRITVSTVGLVEKMNDFLEATNGVRLAVSLNASNDDVRSTIMPVNRRHPIGEIIATVRALPLRRRERVTFEFVLLKGVTDEPAHARELAALLRGLHDRVKLNLIPWNPHEGAPFARPEPGRVEAFRSVLRDNGLNALLRRPRGDDILAACGQLAVESERRKKLLAIE